MALARALQEQERAYFLLQMGHGGGDFNDSGRFFYEGNHFDIPGDDEEYRDEEEDEEEQEEEEDDEEVEEGADAPEEPGIEGRAAGDEQLDGANFDSDEAYARALQDKEDRDTTAHLMALAGIHDPDGGFETDSNDSHDDMWEDVDPDNMSYEELIALGEAVGTESKGLNAQSVAALQQFTYVPESKDSSTDQEQCVVCRLEYEKGDKMLRLPCKHHYHSECIQQWLQHNKVCPVCSAEVTIESSSSDVTNSTN
jgi:E3 ubiquitin-protein ligase BIG BROTHER-like protein